MPWGYAVRRVKPAPLNDPADAASPDDPVVLNAALLAAMRALDDALTPEASALARALGGVRVDTLPHEGAAQETTVDREHGRVRLPALCWLYSRDFGGRREALRWVTPYLPDEFRRWVEAHPEARVAFNGYHWGVVR